MYIRCSSILCWFQFSPDPPNAMKYFPVLLLGIFAGGSLAGNCKRDEKVDLTLLGNAYLNGALSTEVPADGINVMKANFKQQFINNSLTFGQAIMNLTYTWGLERGEELVIAVQNRSFALETCIKSFNYSNTSTCLEYDLEDLNQQFHVFLELIPGTALIKRKPLGDLPPAPEKINPIPTLSAADIFLNLAQAFNDDLSNFNDLIIAIHLQGWREIRQYLNTAQDQFRNQILNDWVLTEYRKIAIKNLESVRTIQDHVKPELWESFRTTCDRIIAISDDYTASKLRDNC